MSYLQLSARYSYTIMDGLAFVKKKSHVHSSSGLNTRPKFIYGWHLSNRSNKNNHVHWEHECHPIWKDCRSRISTINFIKTCFPDGHRVHQGNDPKLASKYMDRFFKFHGIYWWKTPPESLDLNPIENCWGSLRQLLRSSYKPTNLQELMDEIEEFW